MPRPYVKFTKDQKRPAKIPLSGIFIVPTDEETTIMEKWIGVGFRKNYKSLPPGSAVYKKESEGLPGNWNFNVQVVTSKTFFYTLWTPAAWLSDEVSVIIV